MIPMLRAGLLAAGLAICFSGTSFAGKPLYVVTGKAAGEWRPVSADDFATIGQSEIRTKVHTMGDAARSVKGVLARDLMKFSGPAAEIMSVVALDGYAIDVPVSDITAYDVIIATEIDGKPLSVRDKGPAWLIYPVSEHKELDDTIYESRSVWQIKSIEFK